MPEPTTDPRPPDAYRRAPRRNPLALPSARAVMGGLLVAVAVLGVFSAHRAATTIDDAQWLVVDRVVPAGREIAAGDLVRVPMRLADTAAGRAVADPDDVVGRLALVTLRPGDLVVRSSFAEVAPRASDARRIGISLRPADAVGGLLSEGDRVDVAAVGDASTPSEIVARGAIVVRVGGDDGAAVGGDGGTTITLDVVDEAAAMAVVSANAAGGVTLVGASPVELGVPR